LLRFHRAEERYLSLRIISVVCSVIGTLLLAIGTLLLVYGLSTLLVGTTGAPARGGDPVAARQGNVVLHVVPLAYGVGGAFSLLWSFGSLLSGLQFVALGTLFRLAIHLEENTRASAQSLEKLRSRLEPREEGVGPLFRS
jgi:hypothetical protein